MTLLEQNRKDMFGIIRLIIRIGFILLISLLVLAYFTNPDEAAFKSEIKAQLQQRFENDQNNPAISWIAKEANDFTDKAVDNFTTRKNYFICSIYEVTLPMGTYKYLGAFHVFYPLQDENPIDLIGN